MPIDVTRLNRSMIRPMNGDHMPAAMLAMTNKSVPLRIASAFVMPWSSPARVPQSTVNVPRMTRSLRPTNAAA